MTADAPAEITERRTRGEVVRATGLPRHLIEVACCYRHSPRYSAFDEDLAGCAPVFYAAFGADTETTLRHRFAALVRAWQTATVDERQRFRMALLRLERARDVWLAGGS